MIALMASFPVSYECYTEFEPRIALTAFICFALGALFTTISRRFF
jgi:hypothetical protein